MVAIELRAAAGLLAFGGLGFGLPGLYGAWSVGTGRGVPLLFGFPSYGGGPFERIGVKSTVPLLLAFVLVCALEVLAAWLVWEGRKAGAVLALALLAPGLAFWIGFALPIPPILAVARTALLAWRWDGLS